MMAGATVFDTHRFVKNLTASGFTDTQAEALADEFVHLLNSNLGTGTGMAEVKSDLEITLEQFKSDLEMKLEQFKSDILKWMFTAMTAQTALLATAIWYW